MKGRCRWNAALLGLMAGLFVLTAGGAAWGHSGASLLAPENDFVVKWYQPHGEIPVEYWDIEITTLEGARQTFIEQARVFQDTSCWGVEVPIDQRSRVRVRAVSNGQVTNWSGPTLVPEPGFVMSSAICVGGLVGLRRVRRLRGTRSGA
ncbi:MAG: hypothetical protein AB8G23_12375 [Myxococcota bacterium]